ncbi:LysE/ArgO family amino acid transporter [Nocardia terpenica]|uniref:Amino acid transporter n=1 Tax=Nocardia terpenica TaxID=455432 RepID=A0A291RDR2_9NOCA|nr:LysE/ArgO family amino acid transporter [Nocardia terpenica]ATL65448.1 amino acid transporter [Nocardia terpenica]
MNASSAALAALSGLGFGLSLIVAIGAQNAFVLRQGIRREHILAVVAVCAVSDVVLIAAGVGGFGAVLAAAPVVVEIARYGGAAFLFGYAVLAARRAVAPGALTEAADASVALGATVLTALALTWLNPHVYLDTVVLLGSFANTYAGPQRWFLAVGAMLASIGWFTALGYGARLLGPLFARRTAWRVLDSVIAVVMLTLSVMLVVR